MTDWTLWLLAALALASAFFAAQAIRARVRPRRNGAIAALVVAALFVGFAVINSIQTSSRLPEILELVGDPAVRSNIEAQVRSELSHRVAFSILAAMPALALGIGFLGPRRSTPKG
ncbi:MAG TPA: hypothetical protein VFA20_09065 [Myxococcaceae bacterium]|nr:hypothetical protein [Myxococcaceae bacterium]